MENKFLSSKFYRREKRVARTYEIEDEVHDFLVEASNSYNASISDIMNACLRELIKTERINLYKRQPIAYPIYNFYIETSNIEGLNKLKRETQMTIVSLVNMAVKNIMEQNGD